LRFWTFNVADAAISLGIALLLFDTLWRSKSPVRT
jgi:lipoprotein signal peptidase